MTPAIASALMPLMRGMDPERARATLTEERGRLVKRDRLRWVGTPATKLDLTKPVPLVIYPAPSITRTEIQDECKDRRTECRKHVVKILL